MPPLTVHLVSHTHWDREWYRTAGEFRLSLTDLVDEVLDLDVAPHFLLDGQAIVLEDYLAVRPKRADALRSALHAGRVEAGPWYVLGDNLIPGGEALIRNLLAGRALLAQLGAAPPAVLYCPDSFGHPAALPRIGHGFGATLCVVWRGYGGPPWPAGDSARWRDRDGSEILLYHLPPDGYETGANLPPDAAGARAAWERFRTILAPRATLGLALLPNGADHHAVQARRAEALRALAHAAAPHPVVDSTLHAFADALGTRAASYALPVVSGELRQSPAYVWSLQGTFGSRTRQKRENAIVERLLLRHTEPLAALAWWHDGRSRRHLVQGLWRSLLRCHPHDTLCGCSIDAVARAMDQRLDEVQRAASVLAHRARRERLGDDPAAARAHRRVAPGRRRLERLPAHAGRHCRVGRRRAARARRGRPGVGGWCPVVVETAAVAAGRRLDRGAGTLARGAACARGVAAPLSAQRTRAAPPRPCLDAGHRRHGDACRAAPRGSIARGATRAPRHLQRRRARERSLPGQRKCGRWPLHRDGGRRPVAGRPVARGGRRPR
ncbi:MAG: hypothetical protein IPF98_17085 [Gemmatimonadetes bacterium]|nr:hypothetical protein [Gemmatimonadota bacterium]